MGVWCRVGGVRCWVLLVVLMLLLLLLLLLLVVVVFVVAVVLVLVLVLVVVLVLVHVVVLLLVQRRRTRTATTIFSNANETQEKSKYCLPTYVCTARRSLAFLWRIASLIRAPISVPRVRTCFLFFFSPTWCIAFRNTNVSTVFHRGGRVGILWVWSPRRGACTVSISLWLIAGLRIARNPLTRHALVSP